MASLWRRFFARAPARQVSARSVSARSVSERSGSESVTLPEIIRHFNDAASDEEHFPSTIDPRIYHVQLILEHFGDLNGKRVLDVGCGKGRFARVLRERFPGSAMVAVDLAEAMLRRVPSGIGR